MSTWVGGGANGGPPSDAPVQGKVGAENYLRAAGNRRRGAFALSAGSAPLGRALMYFAGYSRLAPLPGCSSTRCGTLVLRYVLLYLQAHGLRHHLSTLVLARWAPVCSGRSLGVPLFCWHCAFILARTTFATRGSIVFMLYAAHDYLWECWFLTGHNTFRSSLRKFGPGARRRTEQYYGHVYLYWCCVRGGGRRALPFISIIWYPYTQLVMCVSIGATPDPTYLIGFSGAIPM